MKTIQLYYPFDFSELDNLNVSNVVYMQIGIEQPQSMPYFSFTEENQNLSDQQTVSISSSLVDAPYLVTDKDVLEWSELFTQSLNTNMVLENLSDYNKRYLIIDIGYEG